MRFLSTATPTVRTFLRNRWPWIVYAALGLGILGCAAILRYSMPQTPFFDGDSWGYLAPAFEKLDGRAFAHLFGRNFVYPAFVFIPLCAWGAYEAVSVCQHALGLVTGVVIALAWNVLCGLVRGVSGRARMAARFGGLMLAADYLLDRHALLFEHSLRPESVFPLAVACSFLFNLCALHAGYVARRPTAERWCLGLNFLAAALAQSLKPSFGFAVVVANLPLLVWLFRRGEPWRAKALVTSIALAVSFFTLWLPEHLLARDDPWAVIFFPTMLFTIHAPAIHEQIADDLRSGDTAPYPASWLTEFNGHLARDLAVASGPIGLGWRLLGFDADYLIYGDSIFNPVFPPGHERDLAAFCRHYYWKTWRRRPGTMLAKIATQLGAIYSMRPGALDVRLNDPRFSAYSSRHVFKWFIGRLSSSGNPTGGKAQRPMSIDYKNSRKCVEDPYVTAELVRSQYGREYAQHLQALADTPASPPVLPLLYLDNALDLLHMPLLALALAAAAVLLTRRREESNAILVAAVGLFFAVNFAMFLTISVAHTLDVARYVNNQRLVTKFSEFAAVLLAWQCAVVLVEKRSSQPLSLDAGPTIPPSM